jgi:hypothetical protein
MRNLACSGPPQRPAAEGKRRLRGTPTMAAVAEATTGWLEKRSSYAEVD